MFNFDFDNYVNPNKEYRMVYAYRLSHGLPCLDGSLYPQDMRDPKLRRAVCAAIVSVRDGLIVSDECHYGFIDHPEFNCFQLIADNEKNLNMNVLARYTVVNGVVEVDQPLLDVVNNVLEVVGVVDKKIYTVDYVDLPPVEVVAVMPMNAPVPDIPSIGFDVYEERLVDSEPIIENFDNYTSIVVPADSTLLYVNMPIDRHLPLANCKYEVVEGSVMLTAEGAKFRADSGALVPSVVVDSVDLYIPEVLVADNVSEYTEVTVKANYSFSAVVTSKYIKDVSMNLFALRLSSRCSDLFDRILKGLYSLPPTILVMRSIDVFTNVIMGLRMPSKNILNQSLVMVGLKDLCSTNYDYKRERWRPYAKWSSWCDRIRTIFLAGKTICRVSSIFDSSHFDYEVGADVGGLFGTMNFNRLPVDDVYLPYSQFIVSCHDKCPTATDVQKSFLRLEYISVNDFVPRPPSDLFPTVTLDQVLDDDDYRGHQEFGEDEEWEEELARRKDII